MSYNTKMDSTITTKGRGFLPNFCGVTEVFMLILVVELFALVLALVPTTLLGFWDRLALSSIFMQWIALINASLLCSLRKVLNKRTVHINALLSFTIMMTVSLLFSLLIIFFGEEIGYYNTGPDNWAQYFLIRNLAISAVVYAVVLRYFFIQHQWKLNIEAQSYAQIQALKARIRPHFLFNSMNTIASLISIDASKAEKAVEDLSDLFRASLKEDTQHTLNDEITLTRSYVDIEHLRLGDRLKIEWVLEKCPENMEIPALCLQPLVENAIYYGIEPIPDGGNIKIRAHIQNNQLCLSVSNPIHSQSHMIKHKSNHMAQQNIRQRLNLMYGEQAEFKITEEPQLYTVSLLIPIKNKQE
jgi:two-component system, LytTR family, sensor histidine kinase AlgZ